MKKKKILRAMVLLAVVAIGLGIYFRRRGGTDTSGGLTLHGNVDIRQVRLAFQATGRLQNLYVEEGHDVKAGQLLAELDASRYQAAMARAEAETAGRLRVRSAGGRHPDRGGRGAGEPGGVNAIGRAGRIGTAQGDHCRGAQPARGARGGTRSGED